MVTSKEVFEKYLALRAEMDAIYNDVLLPRAREICLILHRFEPKSAYFAKTCISVENRHDSDSAYSIPIEWMFDPNVEAAVEAHHEKQRVRYEREHARLEAQSKKALEDKELAELERLLVKYPQVAQKR